MTNDALPEQGGSGRPGGERLGTARAHSGAVPAAALLLAGLILGIVGDVFLRAPGPLGLNMSVWLASVAAAAFVLYRRAGIELDAGRAVWLAIAVLFAACLAWRDSPPLKLLALGSVSLAFAVAAYRVAAAWVPRAGVVRYAFAWALGALHAWVASVLVLVEASRVRGPDIGRVAGWRRAVAVARGLLIAVPLVVVFGALFMSADAVFEDLVLNIVRIDVELIASHVLLFGVTAWLATGYLRGFVTGTEPAVAALSPDGDALPFGLRRPGLSITEIATALAALDVLFLVFVIVQFRYLFGGDALVQVTPDLTYAEYARAGFFELVVAVLLVVPVLLAADWLLVRREPRHDVVFRAVAGAQVVLVLAIAASAFQRLRLYHASYGLTDARFYAFVLLIWVGVMLLWLASSVLRGRRGPFAFGALASGLATVALLFAINPDAVIARTNLARIESAGATTRFDVGYATSLSADAVPVLIDALPSLPADAQCRLARHMLAHWGPDRERSIRSWNWSAWRASGTVREQASRLRAMLGPDRECAAQAAR